MALTTNKGQENEGVIPDNKRVSSFLLEENGGQTEIHYEGKTLLLSTHELIRILNDYTNSLVGGIFAPT